MTYPFNDADVKKTAEDGYLEPQEPFVPAVRGNLYNEAKLTAQDKEDAAVAGLLADLNAEKNMAKTFSFYLSIENVKKLEKLAKKYGVSTSRLLDHIISKL